MAMNNGDDSKNRNVIRLSRSSAKKKEMSRSEQIHKRRIIAIVSVLVFVILFFGFQIIHAKMSESETNSAITTSEKKLKKEKDDNEDLKLKSKQLKDDDYIQKVIRSKYYYSKNGEQVYALPGGDDSNSK